MALGIPFSYAVEGSGKWPSNHPFPQALSSHLPTVAEILCKLMLGKLWGKLPSEALVPLRATIYSPACTVE